MVMLPLAEVVQRLVPAARIVYVPAGRLKL